MKTIKNPMKVRLTKNLEVFATLISALVTTDRRAFLMAALSEMSGKEKELATDPECSSVLERMTYSMDDFVKRVLMDRFAGS